MKNTPYLILILIVLFDFHPASAQISTDSIQEIDGLYYEIGNKEAFTGTAETYYENGQVETSMTVVEGQLDGEMASWYQDGQQLAKGNMKLGVQHGNWTAWYENGNKIREGSYFLGLENGVHTWWTEAAVIIKRGNYQNGQEYGLWEWFYEDGQKKEEGILHGEVHHGVWKDWYEDGSQKTVASFVEGVKDGEWIWWKEDGEVASRKVYDMGELVEGEKGVTYYVERMEYFVGQRDFQMALNQIEMALEGEEDRTEANPVYMGLVAYRAGVYAYFQRLDDAERVILEAVGLSAEEVEIVVESNHIDGTEKLPSLVKRISAEDENGAAGPQLALAYIYNILGDTVKIQEHQQSAIERSDFSDWIVQLSLNLYKYRGEKENTYGILNEIRGEINRDGVTRENQFELAWYLFIAGHFEEAIAIADTYLTLDDRDIDFLYIKMNTAMAFGQMDEMELYESRILEIDPSAFD